MASGHPETAVEAALEHAAAVPAIDAFTSYVERGVVLLEDLAPADAVAGVPSAPARALAGERLRLWDEIFFGIILVIPRTANVGAVVSLTSFQVEVWNADELAHRCLSVGVSGSDGVTVAAGPVLPAWWPPYTSYFSTIDVGPDGEANIDSLVTWLFPGFAGTDCHVLGVRLSVWPLAPEGSADFEETVGFLTDVMTAHDGTEQRRGLREVAERVIAFRGLAIGFQEIGALIVRLLTQGRLLFSVPYWPDAIRPRASIAAGASSIAVDTTTRLFEAGGLVILWRDEQTWETCKVDAVGPSSLILRSPTAGAWPAGSTLVIPLLSARLVDDAQLEGIAPGVKEITARFRTEPSANFTGRSGPVPPEEGPLTATLRPRADFTWIDWAIMGIYPTAWQSLLTNDPPNSLVTEEAGRTAVVYFDPPPAEAVTIVSVTLHAVVTGGGGAGVDGMCALATGESVTAGTVVPTGSPAEYTIALPVSATGDPWTPARLAANAFGLYSSGAPAPAFIFEEAWLVVEYLPA